MDPQILAKSHSGIAILIMLLYIIRGGLMLAGSAKVRSLILSSISYLLVIVLISLGLYTAYLKGISFGDGFIITKIICLTAFIVFSSIAFKQGLSKMVATILWLLGLAALVYAYLLGKHIVPPLF